MRILALDASTKTVGWCKAHDDDYLASGVFIAKGANWVKRIWSIQNFLCSLRFFEDAGHDTSPLWPDIAFIERPTGNHHNMTTNIRLGGLLYAVLAFFDERGIECMEVTASQVRASGCHKKALWVAENYKGRPLHPKHPGDEADAIGVWLAGLGKWKERELANTS